MELIKTRLNGTQVHLVKASFEHDVVLTHPDRQFLETTRQFAQRVGAKLAINTNFFTWMKGENIAGPGKALKWVLGFEKLPISASDIRKTLQGKAAIPSGIFGAYYFEGKCIIPPRSGLSINFIPGHAPSFSFSAPVHPYHVIEGTFPLIFQGNKIQNQDASTHQKTIIAASKNEYLFLVSDGRGNGGSPGVGYPVLQDFLLQHGAVNAAGVDGGESTSLVLNGKQLAFPCDSHVALAKLPNPFALLALMKKSRTERPVGLNLGLR